MNRRVLLLGQKLEMLGIHALRIETEVMYLPLQGTVWTGLNGNGSIHFGPCNPVCVFCPTATGKRDCGIAALARKASVPVKAGGYGVDGVFAFQTGGSTYSGTFYWHLHFPLPARRPES
jgi:hypothetical protein